jgi:DNA mismatch repair ATPase MutS
MWTHRCCRRTTHASQCGIKLLLRRLHYRRTDALSNATCAPTNTKVYHKSSIIFKNKSSITKQRTRPSLLEKSINTTPLTPVWTRGAKRTATVTLPPVPILQGALPKTVIEEDDTSLPAAETYPRVIQQALNNMRRFSNHVVLTRVGNFYELYFDQAETYSKLLNLKLAAKPISGNRKVPMSGFPYFQLDRYLKVLVQDLNQYVVMVEEFANDAEAKVKSGGLLFDRKVTRVITPGTLIDEKFMDPWENNFVLAVFSNHAPLSVGTMKDTMERKVEEARQDLGLAWLDLSSGDFFTQKTTLDSLSSALARIGPREIIVDPSLSVDSSSPVLSVLKEGHFITTQHEPESETSSLWISMLEEKGSHVNYGSFSEQEVGAGSFLLEYVHKQLQGKLPNLRPPMQRNHEDYMTIDTNSLKALEVRQTLRDGGLEGSLLHAVRKTVTKSGHRLLCQRLMSPSTSMNEINERLDLVTELLHTPILREDLVTLLTMTFDSWRLLQKFSFGRGDADDLVSLARTIKLTTEVRELLIAHLDGMASTADKNSGEAAIKRLLERLELQEPHALANQILEAIDEEKLSEQHRIEDDEAAAVVELAEGVLSDQGEQLRGIPKAVKGRRAAAGIGAEADKEKDSSLAPEVWIMRPS